MSKKYLVPQEVYKIIKARGPAHYCVFDIYADAIMNTVVHH